MRWINIIQVNYWKYVGCSKKNWSQFLIQCQFLKSQNFAQIWKHFQSLSIALNFLQGRIAFWIH